MVLPCVEHATITRAVTGSLGHGEFVGTVPAVSGVPDAVVQLAIAAALGLFVGVEREWASKAAGVRTFALVSLTGAAFALLARREPWIGGSLVVVGAVFVAAQGVFLAVRGLLDGESLSATTGISLLVAYGAGVLVAAGYRLAATVVVVVSAGLLVLRRELHGFAAALSRAELRSMTEFAALAFVVYPLLPAGERTVVGVAVEPRVAWLMVVTVAAIGGVNYAVVRTYDGRGVAVTGFLGGLVSSTAVVGTMLDHVRGAERLTPVAVAGTLLANGAMAGRNLAIAMGFTLAAGRPVLVDAALPLGALLVGSVAVALWTCDWREPVAVELESPFSLRNALGFGAVFLGVLVLTGVAEAQLGTTGLFLSALVSGVVSSAGATTSAVVLYRSGAVGSSEAATAILLATGASVAVKVGLAVAGPRAFTRRVTGYSTALLLAAGATTLVVAAA